MWKEFFQSEPEVFGRIDEQGLPFDFKVNRWALGKDRHRKHPYPCMQSTPSEPAPSHFTIIRSGSDGRLRYSPAQRQGLLDGVWLQIEWKPPPGQLVTTSEMRNCRGLESGGSTAREEHPGAARLAGSPNGGRHARRARPGLRGFGVDRALRGRGDPRSAGVLRGGRGGVAHRPPPAGFFRGSTARRATWRPCRASRRTWCCSRTCSSTSATARPQGFVHLAALGCGFPSRFLEIGNVLSLGQVSSSCVLGLVVLGLRRSLARIIDPGGFQGKRPGPRTSQNSFQHFWLASVG